MLNLSAKVYTLACFKSWSPVSSMAGLAGSASNVPESVRRGKYSPV